MEQKDLSWLSEFESHLMRLTGQKKMSQVKALSFPYQARRTFRVILSDKTQLILKWFASKKAAEKCHGILMSLQSSGIPIPSSVGFVSFEEHKGSALLMEHLPGERWYDVAGTPEFDRIRLDTAIDVLIHLESLDPKLLSWREVPSDHWQKVLLRDVEEYEIRIRETSLPSITEKANKMLRSLAFDPWGQVPDHGDFGPHNTLFDGVVLTGVVDWDDAVIQDRSVTLGIVVAEVLTLEIPIEQRRVLVSQLILLR
jgi:aminoglycoside phosphotransferase (APT) family kinase protein